MCIRALQARSPFAAFSHFRLASELFGISDFHLSTEHFAFLTCVLSDLNDNNIQLSVLSRNIIFFQLAYLGPISRF